MFLMGRETHFRLYGMPMGGEMVAGMGAIVLGIAVAAYGLLPKNISKQLRPARTSSSRHRRMRRSRAPTGY